ncbi:hypothetical protein BDV98DRAFT_472045, partial [Pterulicium gracile]
KLHTVTSCMKGQQMSVPLFLHYLFYSNDMVTADAVCRYQRRTAHTTSDELSQLFQIFRRDPRTKHKGKQPYGARKDMKEFAVECVDEMVDRGMKLSTPVFLCPP